MLLTFVLFFTEEHEGLQSAEGGGDAVGFGGGCAHGCVERL